MGRGLAASQTERAYEQAAHHDEQRQQRHCAPLKTPPRMRISTSTRIFSSADLFVLWVGLRAPRQEPQVHDGEYCAGFEHRKPVHPALTHRGLCEAQSRPTAMAVSPVFARITS